VAAARGFVPQVVFLDLNLPDGDGFTVLERVRAEMAQPPLFAAMTGYGQESDRARTRDAGFALHLVKPVVPEQVQEALDLASRRADED
jgi:CheY-like chemotaxis protein